ncbi:MAG TPA: hypothetical protein VES42_23645 [Pilimelia sp.]|nr:hypothetical protein [Pilimelia sp.]
MAGLEAVRSAVLAGVVRPAREYADTASGVHRVLPVLAGLSRVLPGRGLRRGSTIAVATGRPAWPSGSSSLLLALLAEASRAGSWCAVVGVPTFGAVAATEAGIVLDRLALVPYPGPEWPTVVAALIDGVDVVVTAVPAAVSASVASRLAAPARQRGCVLVPYGRWVGADVTLQVTRGVWQGLGQGRGRLRSRQLAIAARGRGAATRAKEVTIWMPGVPGGVPSGVASAPDKAALVKAGTASAALPGVPPTAGRGPRRPALALVDAARADLADEAR